MSSATGRPGRPPGPSAETLAKGRHFLSLVEYGVSESTIAAREGIAVSDVYRAINIVRPLAAVDSKPAPELSRTPQKLPEGTLLRRAFAAIRNVRAFKGLLDAETREFWIEALIEIRALADDGVELTFGRPGDVYHSQAEFLSVFNNIKPAQLEALFHHAMLVDLSGVGVALPYRWGFRAGSNAPVRRAAKAPALRPQPTLEAVDGGLSDSEKIRINSDKDSEETPIYSEFSPPINSESPGLAYAATAAANAKEDQYLNGSSSSIGSPAGDSELIAGFSEKIPPSDSEKTLPARSALAQATIELMALAKITRAPNADDLGAVRKWLEAAYAMDAMRGVIETKMEQRNGKPPPTSLVYFNAPMHQALGSKLAPAPASSPAAAPAPAAVLSAADQVLKDELHGLWQRAHTARKSRLPPVFAAYQAAASNGHEPDARRWLAVYKGCLAADSLGGLPEFGSYLTSPADYEATLLEIEDALTAPDPGAAD